MAHLDAYLDVYGWRPEMWVELTLPLWAEDPTPLMGLITGFLEDPRADPRRAGRRAAARLVRSMAEAHRLAPGEVLVCRTSSPAWTPLIARAAAVVAA